MPKAERREQLLDAALGVIAEEGYASVSIEAIAKRVDLSRPVVYGVFDGLGPLLEALLDRQEERALEQILAALPAAFDAGDPLGFVDATVRRLVEVVTSDPLTWGPILAPADGVPAEVKTRIDGAVERVRKRIEGLLAAVLDSQGAKADAEVASHALIGMGLHFGRVVVEHPRRLTAERIAATVTGMVSGLAVASRPMRLPRSRAKARPAVR